MRNFFVTLLIILFSVSTSAQSTSTPTKKIKHVIYVTLDGTRWQDVFNNHSLFTKLWEKHSKGLIFYGAPGDNNRMEVASVPISLPSYQSQMSGSVQPFCMGNDCGRINVETLGENILHKLKLQPKDVAIFSSWAKIGFAAEHIPGTIFANIGNMPVYDPVTQKPDDFMAQVNIKQALNPAGDGDRFDRYTVRQALHYFDKYRPVFLWLSLAESDNTAHEGDLKGYHKALSYYDEVIDSLITYLQKSNLAHETLVIVTTDHGRGNGPNWTEHGPIFPESKQTWAFVMNGELKPIKEHYYNTNSIRPTVENALGLY